MNMSKQHQQTTVKELTCQEERGKLIYEAGNVRRINDNYYEVTSQSNTNVTYGVDIVNCLCDCEDAIRNYGTGTLLCKHIISTQYDRTERIRKVLLEDKLQALS